MDLTHVPKENNLSNNDGNMVPGFYAIIEPAWRNPAVEEQGLSQLVECWIKKEEPNPKLKGTACAPSVSQLVNLDKLLSPLVVVPDLDNTNPRAYLRVLSRSLWAGVYEDYLVDDHP